MTVKKSIYVRVQCWICRPSIFRSRNYTSVRRISQIFPTVSRIFYIYHYYARLLYNFRVPLNLPLEILLLGYMIAKGHKNADVPWIKKVHSILWYYYLWFKYIVGHFLRYSDEASSRFEIFYLLWQI